MQRLDEERSLAARVAASAELRDVRLFNTSSELFNPAVDLALTYTFSNDIECQVVSESDCLIVTGIYDLKVRQAPEAEGEKVEPANIDEPANDDEPDSGDVARLRFQLAALFDVEVSKDKDPFTDEEYEAYASTTGQFALYPYAREFVAELTGRMGLPPLHLGALKFNLDRRNQD